MHSLSLSGRGSLSKREANVVAISVLVEDNRFARVKSHRFLLIFQVLNQFGLLVDVIVLI